MMADTSGSADCWCLTPEMTSSFDSPDIVLGTMLNYICSIVPLPAFHLAHFLRGDDHGQLSDSFTEFKQCQPLFVQGWGPPAKTGGVNLVPSFGLDLKL